MPVPVTTLVDPQRTVALRRAVLRRHESLAEVAAETRGPDLLAVAVLEGDAVVACALARPEPCPDPVVGSSPWRLRGMASDVAHRGRGLGSAVLERVLAEVGGRGGDVVWCNARTPARGFYERAGFVTVGEPWDDPVIGPHVRMWVRPGRPDRVPSREGLLRVLRGRG